MDINGKGVSDDTGASEEISHKKSASSQLQKMWKTCPSRAEAQNPKARE